MNCRLIKELLSYNSANRLLITGTPLQNNITELWSLLHFLLPDIFNDLSSFQSWFDFSSMLDNNGQADVVERRKRTLVSTMHSILKPFLLRRVKTDVETALPKKREYILYAPLTAEQKDLYREILNGTGRQYLENKARERIMAQSKTLTRSTSRKRGAESSGSSTPNKSIKSSRDSTPASNGSGTRRRRGPQSYREISDREFLSKLRKIEQGIEDELEIEDPNESEQEELERANSIKLASMYFSTNSSGIIISLTKKQKKKSLKRRCKTPSCKPAWPATPPTTSTGPGATTQPPSTNLSSPHQAKCSSSTDSSHASYRKAIKFSSSPNSKPNSTSSKTGPPSFATGTAAVSTARLARQTATNRSRPSILVPSIRFSF